MRRVRAYTRAYASRAYETISYIPKHRRLCVLAPKLSQPRASRERQDVEDGIRTRDSISFPPSSLPLSSPSSLLFPFPSSSPLSLSLEGTHGVAGSNLPALSALFFPSSHLIPLTAGRSIGSCGRELGGRSIERSTQLQTANCKFLCNHTCARCSSACLCPMAQNWRARNSAWILSVQASMARLSPCGWNVVIAQQSPSAIRRLPTFLLNQNLPPTLDLTIFAMLQQLGYHWRHFPKPKPQTPIRCQTIASTWLDQVRAVPWLQLANARSHLVASTCPLTARGRAASATI